MAGRISSRTRGLATALALALAATACSAVPNVINGAQGTSSLSGGLGGNGQGSSTLTGGTGATGTTTGGGLGTVGGTTTTGGVGGTTNGGTAQGGGVGGTNGNVGTGLGATVRGIDSKFINIVFHEPLTKASDAGKKAYLERVATFVKWFNLHIKYPGGRKLKYTIVDDCGPTTDCYDAARAAALKITQQIKPYASLGNSVNLGADLPIIADVTTRAGIIEIGVNFQTVADLASRSPYAWEPYELAEVSMQELGWGIGKRYQHTNYVDDQTVTHKRVWATVMYDNKADRYLGGAISKEVAGFGVSVAHHYYVSGDAGTAAQQAPALAAQMQSDGVNSVIFDVTNQSGVAVTTAFDNAQYHPDWFVGAYGGYLGSAVFVPLFGTGFTKRLYGAGAPCIVCERLDVDATGANCPSCNVVDNGTAYTKAYHSAGGSAQNPQQDCGCAYDTWTQLAVLSIGILNGGAFDTQHYSQGLYAVQQNRCNIWRFFGRDHPQFPLYTFGPNRHFGSSGMTTLYWVNKQNRFGTVGYWESYDDYYRYDSFAAVPAKATYDTGQHGDYPMVTQKQTISVDKAC
jgi:hypothetical protein